MSSSKSLFHGTVRLLHSFFSLEGNNIDLTEMNILKYVTINVFCLKKKKWLPTYCLVLCSTAMCRFWKTYEVWFPPHRFFPVSPSCATKRTPPEKYMQEYSTTEAKSDKERPIYTQIQITAHTQMAVLQKIKVSAFSFFHFIFISVKRNIIISTQLPEKRL